MGEPVNTHADLTTPYKPVAIRFSDPERIEYVNADVPTVARDVDDRFALLLDCKTLRPVGFRYFGRVGETAAAPPAPVAGPAVKEGHLWTASVYAPDKAEAIRMRDAVVANQGAPVIGSGEVREAVARRFGVALYDTRIGHAEPRGSEVWGELEPTKRADCYAHADAVLAALTPPALALLTALLKALSAQHTREGGEG
jgi:hypothetical protein